MMLLFFILFLLNGDPPANTHAAQTRVQVGEITKTSPVGMAIRGAAKAMLRRNEGVRLRVYPDTAFQPTIGVGFNLNRPDAKDRLAKIKRTRRGVMNAGITEAEADALLDADLTDVLQDLVTLFPDFVDMPERARLVLIDLRYNCGPGGLRTFIHTLQSIKTARWDDAATRLAASQWAEQVGTRAHRAITMLRGIS